MRSKKCYSCAGSLGRDGWRYIGTEMIICAPCHEGTKLKETRGFVEVGSSVRVAYASAFRKGFQAGPWRP